MVSHPAGVRPATWTMGILTTGEWTAQWIGRDDGPAWNTGSTFFNANWIWYPEGNPTVSAPVATRWFRKAFTVPAGMSVSNAVATMAGDNMFYVICQRPDCPVRGKSKLLATLWPG